MNSFNWKSIVPHLIAVGIFLLIAAIFCYPALDSSLAIVQGDMTGTQGMTHQSYEYLKVHGYMPLWTPYMFGGMPTFQTIFGGTYNPLLFIDKLFQLWLPKPVSYFFLLSTGFYVLTVCLNVRTWVGIIASLAFAYCTYDPIIAAVGHQTKILAIAYAPAVLGAVILIFEKKYLQGFILAALFASLELLQNHIQTTYYLFMAIGFMSVAYIIQWIKAGEFKHLSVALGLSILAGGMAVMNNSLTLLPVYDYAKESKRGGQLVMDDRISAKDNIIKDNKTKGMSKEYAFQWSYGKAETMSLMFPGVMGYGYHGSQRDGETRVFPNLDENSHVAKFLGEKLGEEQGTGIAQQLSGSLYWGDQPFTAGPVYLGAIVCFLFIFGMFYLDGKHKWWILATSIAAIFMAWGYHFATLNNFLFDYLPFYKNWRTPTQILVIPQILFPIIGALVLDKLITNRDEQAWKSLRLTTFATAAVFVVAAALYFSLDYAKENKQRTSAFNVEFANASGGGDAQAKIDALNQKFQPETDNQLYENFVFQSKGDMQLAKGVVNALRQDRAAAFGSDIFRSLIFVALAIVLIGLFIRKKINMSLMLAGVGILTMIDLLSIDTNYLNKTNYINKEEYDNSQFPFSAADEQILKDKDPNYRVFNYAGGDPFQESKTSYYHKSIGGYHPVKVGIYDDLITYQLSGKLNEQVLNMLNAKYIIQNNPQTNQPMAFPNPGALGNVWFVKAVKFVNGPVEEMKGLNNFNPKDTAIIDAKYKNDVTGFTPADSLSTIKQTIFDNDAITYESEATAPKLAIFSEIFYKDWYAYIDGKKTNVVKANYVLRGLLVPAGKHKIEFKFEPAAYKIGNTIAPIASWFLVLLLLAYIVKEFFLKKKTAEV